MTTKQLTAQTKNQRDLVGKRFLLEDGSKVYVIMMYKFGRGYGVVYSKLSPREYLDNFPCKDSNYMQFSKFKKLIKEVVERQVTI